MSTMPKYLGYGVTESEVEYGYATSEVHGRASNQSMARIVTMLGGCTDENAPLLFKGSFRECILGGDDYPVPPVD